MTNLSLRIEGNPLFEAASVVIPTGHKVGLVGRNGTGKTTLFNLLTGDLQPDDGTVEVPKSARIGGVAQEAPATQASLLSTVLDHDVERTELLSAAETVVDAAALADIHTRLVDIDAYSAEARAAAILYGLGFDADAQRQACADFSGGWRMRVALAGVLFAQPDILLLDEPTNYLDLEGTIWLESYLASYPHTVVVISHDRALLNRSVRSILHLQDRKLTLYSGNYDQFEAVRQARLDEQAATRKKQDLERAHLQSYVDRFRYKASKAKQAQSRIKMLARMQPVADDRSGASVGFHFPSDDTLNPPILKLEDVSVGYAGTPVLRNISLRIDQDDRIALLGNNGQGKSTLSKLLSGRLNPIDGHITKAQKLRVGYFAQHQLDELHPDESPLQHLGRQRPGFPPAKLRSILAQGGLGAQQANTEVTRLSGGQKARLALLLATLDAPHLLILDEPTNHLDIESRAALVQALTAFAGAVVLVSHDPYLINLVADRLWLVKDARVKPYDDDLDSYRKMLLADRGMDRKVEKSKERGPKQGHQRQKDPAVLRAEVSKCEARITKLETMKSKLDAKLGDAGLYAPAKRDDLARLQAKHAELTTAMERAELMWLQAVQSAELEESR